MHGKRGDLAAHFRVRKIRHGFQVYFFCRVELGIACTSETPMSGFKLTAVKGCSVWGRRKEDKRAAPNGQADRHRALQQLSPGSSNKVNQMIRPSSNDGDVSQRLARP
jgi:hypothetical protein